MSLLVGPAMGPGHRKSRDVQSGNHSTTLGNLHEGIPLIGFMSNFVVLGFLVCRDGDAAAVGVMGCYPRRVNPDFEDTAVCGCLRCGKLSAAGDKTGALTNSYDATRRPSHGVMGAISNCVQSTLLTRVGSGEGSFQISSRTLIPLD